MRSEPRSCFAVTRIALGSAAETQRLLAIAAERGYLPPTATTPLIGLADRTVACLIGLLRSRNPAIRHRPPTEPKEPAQELRPSAIG
jgi:hypothetical protein